MGNDVGWVGRIARWLKAAGEAGQIGLVRIGRGQRHLDAGCQFGDARGDLTKARRRVSNWTSRQNDSFRQAAQAVQHPVWGDVDQQAELVGRRLGAGGAVRGEVQFVHFNQVLGLAATAIDTLVQAPYRPSW